MDAYDDDEWADSDFEPEVESPEKLTDYKPSYVLIAIDTDHSMFEKDGSETIPFLTALNACYDIANSLVLSGQHSLKGPVGVVLADNNNVSSNLVEFEQTVPDTIKLLKSLKEQSQDELQKKYGRKQNFDLADFFLSCKNKLLNVKTEAYKRIIIYITNDDNPTKNDAKKKFKVINESQKFLSIQMELVVVTFNPNFDYTTLYSEVLEASNSAPVEQVSPDTLTQKLSSLIHKKHTMKKCKFYPFPGNTKSYFTVAIAKPTTDRKILKNMHVTRDTQKEVKKTFKQNTADTYTCLYAKDEPPLTLNVMERQNLGETKLPIGYSLTYVSKPILKPGWVVDSPYLMEKHSKESLQLFEVFWQFCTDKNRCLVCYQKLKSAGNVRFVELIPKLINGKRQFLVKILPYGSEIHYNPVNSHNLIDFTKEEEKAMESMVDALTFKYDVHSFRDPVESKKQAYIKSQLLEEKLEEIIDCIEPDNVINERLSESIVNLEKLDLLESVARNKRSFNSTYTKSNKKKFT